MPTLIIAEAGVNHNGQLDLAYQLIEAAAHAGADYVKFQSFQADLLVTEQAQQAQYQTRNTGKPESQYAMLKRLELSPQDHWDLYHYCQQQGIEFLSTAFESKSLAFLVHELGLKTLKIPSGELTNLPFVLQHARTGCDLIVSTGMANLGEIEEALSVIAFGLLSANTNTPWTPEAGQAALYSEQGQACLAQKVTLLHCTTEYPAPVQEIHLRAMQTLANAFHLPVGYSDHSEGISIPIAAVACGAQVIEKHFTLDRNLPGPDHQASLEPDELATMVTEVRRVEAALGNGIKGIQTSELKNKAVARKSLVAACDIAAGEAFNTENLACKRPGTGLAPKYYWQLLNKPASRAYQAGELIQETCVFC